MRLSAEHPREALARDEAMLAEVSTGGPPLVRWWVPASTALVVGLGLRHRISEIVDVDRCRAAGVEVLERQAGGGLVLLDQHMLCGAICLPIAHPLVTSDLTESYRWLGDHFARRLGDRVDSDAESTDSSSVRRVEVDEARADIAALRSSPDPRSRLLLATCYGALSPHEVVLGQKKLVGLAQVRRRHAALFQIGVLVRDQSDLADFIRVQDEAERAQLRAALRLRTVGLENLGVSLEQGLLLVQTDELA